MQDENDDQGNVLDQSRACALGRNEDKPKPVSATISAILAIFDDKIQVKNLSIDKLKNWNHFGPPFSAHLLKVSYDNCVALNILLLLLS